MSVREYIGARYVPVFADPLEWDNTKMYEPLTIVMYQGNSYTSKQTVPTGIDIKNEEYWVVTGNYNAQIDAYRNQVNTLQNTYDALNETVNDLQDDYDGLGTAATKDVTTTVAADNNNLVTSAGVFNALSQVSIEPTIVVIGDSFVDDGADRGVAFNEELKKIFQTTKVYNYAVSGTGFVVGGTNNFQNQLTTAYSDTSFNNTDVAMIIVVGNINDMGQTVSAIETAVGNFNTYAKSRFPHAAIHYCIGDGRYLNKVNDIRKEQSTIYYLQGLGALVHNILGIVPPMYYESNGEHWSGGGERLALNKIFFGNDTMAVPNLSGASSYLTANNFGTAATTTLGSVFINGYFYPGNTNAIAAITMGDKSAAAGSVIMTIPNSYIQMCLPYYADRDMAKNVKIYKQDGTLVWGQWKINTTTHNIDITTTVEIPSTATYIYADLGDIF